MACVDISEWNPEQVAEWLRGLDDTLLPYVHFFLNNSIDGNHLLLLGADDLSNLNVTKLGHQELILEAVELLRHFHYGLNTENLQSLSLKVSCKARSLFNDLRRNCPNNSENEGKQERVTTPILSTTADVLVSVKNLISWLDRSPFNEQEQYIVIRNLLLHISIELATNALRDKFAVRPIDVIKSRCLRLCEICEKIVQESTDPMILQPASIDIATIKKKPDEELGLYIRSSFSGIHHIGQIKYESPAHFCGRIEDGDEVVQVNYQTVVGWQLKKLVVIMRENPMETVLTLKKRPRHGSYFGQIFSRSLYLHCKRPSPFITKTIKDQDLISYPSFDLNCSVSIQQNSPKDLPEEEDEDDDSAFLPDNQDGTSNANNVVNLLLRPRAVVQRRATVTGASPNNTRPPVSIDQLWLLARRDQVMRSVSHDPGRITPEGDTLENVKTPSEGSTEGKFEISQETVSLKEKSSPLPLARPFTCIGTNLSMEPALANDNKNFRVFDCLQDASSHQFFDTVGDQTTKSSSNDKNENIFQIKEEVPLAKEEIVNEKEPNEKVNNIEIQKSIKKGSKESLSESSNLQLKTEDNFEEIQPELENEDEPHVACRGHNVLSGSSSLPAIDSSQSYQVFIAGGVAHVSAPMTSVKDPTRSPKHSPILRKKSKNWEFSNRRISCKDLGLGDCQGWLYKRKDHKGLLAGSRWIKRWCILKNRNFYCYKDKDDEKAESLIYLPGFNVSPAPEIKSKKFAFKVYHSGTTFYYASDTQQDMSKWMNKMGLAAIAYDGINEAKEKLPILPTEIIYYSETEDDSEENFIEITQVDCEEPSISSNVSTDCVEPDILEKIDVHVEPEKNSQFIPEKSTDDQTEFIDSASYQIVGDSLQTSDVKFRSNNTLPNPTPDTKRKTVAVDKPADMRKANSYDFVECFSSSSLSASSLAAIKDKRKTSDGALFVQRLKSNRKSSFQGGKSFFRDKFPLSANISSISLRSVKSNASTPYCSLTSVSSIAEDDIEKQIEMTRTVDARKSFVNKGTGYGSEPATKTTEDAPLEKILSTTNLSTAFEMSLDAAPPNEEAMTTVDDAKQHDPIRRLSKPIAYLNKLSPRALKKLSSQAKVEKKRKCRSTFFFDNDVDYSQLYENAKTNDPSFRNSSAQTDLQAVREITSPQLFWLEHHQNAIPLYKTNNSDPSCPKAATWNARHLKNSKSFSEKARIFHDPQWNSMPRKTYYKTKLTVQIGSENQEELINDGEESPRAPLTPAMGVSMIGKQRRNSAPSDKVESKSPASENVASAVMSQATQTDHDDELSEVFDMLNNLCLTNDDSYVNIRHKSCVFTSSAHKHHSLQLVLKSLENTLKAKEEDLKVIDQFLETSIITSTTLQDWVLNYPHLCQTSNIKCTEC